MNNSQYNGEPAIKNGDLVKRGGDYERVSGLNNEILILIGTDSGYWGNLIEPPNSQIPGGYEELNGLSITSNFLKRNSQKIEACLNTMIVNGDAKSIKAESFNRSADRISWTALITLKDGQRYYFDGESSTGKFI
jgi:phage gp46-like protein